MVKVVLKKMKNCNDGDSLQAHTVLSIHDKTVLFMKKWDRDMVKYKCFIEVRAHWHNLLTAMNETCNNIILSSLDVFSWRKYVSLLVYLYQRDLYIFLCHK